MGLSQSDIERNFKVFANIPGMDSVCTSEDIIPFMQAVDVMPDTADEEYRPKFIECSGSLPKTGSSYYSKIAATFEPVSLAVGTNLNPRTNGTNTPLYYTEDNGTYTLVTSGNVVAGKQYYKCTKDMRYAYVLYSSEDVIRKSNDYYELTVSKNNSPNYWRVMTIEDVTFTGTLQDGHCKADAPAGSYYRKLILVEAIDSIFEEGTEYFIHSQNSVSSSFNNLFNDHNTFVKLTDMEATGSIATFSSSHNNCKVYTNSGYIIDTYSNNRDVYAKLNVTDTSTPLVNAYLKTGLAFPFYDHRSDAARAGTTAPRGAVYISSAKRNVVIDSKTNTASGGFAKGGIYGCVYDEETGLYHWDLNYYQHEYIQPYVDNINAYAYNGKLYVTWTDPMLIKKQTDEGEVLDEWYKTSLGLKDPVTGQIQYLWSTLLRDLFNTNALVVAIPDNYSALLNQASGTDHVTGTFVLTTTSKVDSVFVKEFQPKVITWKIIQEIVRSGKAKQFFSTGDVITLPEHDDYGEMTAKIIDFDNVKPSRIIDALHTDTNDSVFVANKSYIYKDTANVWHLIDTAGIIGNSISQYNTTNNCDVKEAKYYTASAYITTEDTVFTDGKMYVYQDASGTWHRIRDAIIGSLISTYNTNHNCTVKEVSYTSSVYTPVTDQEVLNDPTVPIYRKVGDKYYAVDAYNATTDQTFSATKTYFKLIGSVYREISGRVGGSAGYAITSDETFQFGKTYYNAAENNTFVAITVTTGANVAAAVASSGLQIYEKFQMANDTTYPISPEVFEFAYSQHTMTLMTTTPLEKIEGSITGVILMEMNYPEVQSIGEQTNPLGNNYTKRSSRWATSAIRHYLNGETSNWANPSVNPFAKNTVNTSELLYAGKGGFLYGWSSNEATDFLNTLISVRSKTVRATGTSSGTPEYEYTDDKVWLLSPTNIQNVLFDTTESLWTYEGTALQYWSDHNEIADKVLYNSSQRAVVYMLRSSAPNGYQVRAMDKLGSMTSKDAKEGLAVFPCFTIG